MKSAHLYKMGRHGLTRAAHLGYLHALLAQHFALFVYPHALSDQGQAPLAALGCPGPVLDQPLHASGST